MGLAPLLREAGSGSASQATQLKHQPEIETMNLRTRTLRPLGTLAGLNDLHREVARLFEATATPLAPVFPALNFSQTEDTAFVTAEVPGVNPADLSIQLHQGRLTIGGEWKDDAPQGENVVCHRKERPVGNFSRTIALPFEVEESAISAKCENGILTITLPRAERSKPKTIPVSIQ
jgi:HSP20 family protein